MKKSILALILSLCMILPLFTSCSIVLNPDSGINKSKIETESETNFDLNINSETDNDADDIPQMLEFVFEGDGTCKVAGIGTYQETNIVIPTYSPEGCLVTGIEPYAFYGENITSVTIPKSVTSIGYYAFGSCVKLVEIINHSSLSICAGSSDYGYIAYHAKEVHDGTTKIVNQNDYLFYICEEGNYLVNYIGSSETSLVLPENYKGQTYEIYNYAFAGCANITNLTIPRSVTCIGEWAFDGCPNLTSVTMELGTTILSEGAFYRCSNLKSVIISDSVVSIGSCAFAGCEELESVTIGSGVTFMGSSAFSDCYNLKGVYITDISTWCAIDFEGNRATPLSYSPLLYLDGKVVTDLVIPDGVTEISDMAFYQCPNLTSVTIPNSVTRIGKYAFYNCQGIMSVTVGENVITIGDRAFEGCEKIIEVINLSGRAIFAGSTSYGHIAYYAKEVHRGTTKIVNQNGYLFYTAYPEEDYKTNYLVGYVGNETSLVLPENYEGQDYDIYEYAFNYCTSITSIIIPSCVTVIKESAFTSCENLTSIIIPDSVTEIYSAAFSGCYGLTSIILPNSIDYLPGFMFASCTSLTNITIPDNVKSIAGSAFLRCSSLTNIIIPESVTRIGSHAFEDCSSLASITIPDSVTSIGDSAFYYCTSLTSINFDGTMAKWNAISKGSNWNYPTGNYTIYCTDGTISKQIKQAQ